MRAEEMKGGTWEQGEWRAPTERNGERGSQWAESVAAWATEWDQPNLTLPTAQEATDALFEFAPVVWSRLADFQDVSMRLIAEQLRSLDWNGSYVQFTYMDGEIT